MKEAFLQNTQNTDLCTMPPENPLKELDFSPPVKTLILQFQTKNKVSPGPSCVLAIRVPFRMRSETMKHRKFQVCRLYWPSLLATCNKTKALILSQ